MRRSNLLVLVTYYWNENLLFQEQAIERDQELEEYQKELNKWKQEALNKDKMNKSENRLQKEVGIKGGNQWGHI